jgi:predicted ATPase
MKIQKFKFSNHKQNWHIEEVSFNELNLLVGASGVGKTRILRSLDLVCHVAKGNINSELDDLEWAMNFSHLGKDYKWELKSAPSEENLLKKSDQPEIVYEKLVRYDNDAEIEIILRTTSASKLNSKDLPKLKRTESAITLLSEEDSLIPVGQAFNRLIFNETPQEAIITFPMKSDEMANFLFAENFIPLSIEQIEAVANAPVILKALLLQRSFPDIFDELKDYYTDIFPNVEDIRVGFDGNGVGLKLYFEIKEAGVEAWIPQILISSGMFRTLNYLVDIISAPTGSVILIDEFENSLGINCMPQLTNFILEKSVDQQFILTSHHPYIINHIDWKTWQIVIRKGNRIRVRKATDIPELNTASSLDKFTQLINLPDYEDMV